MACLQMMASSLSGVMLLALEVAVEYWLALSWSPQAQWLSESEVSSILQSEVGRPLFSAQSSSYCPPTPLSAVLPLWTGACCDPLKATLCSQHKHWSWPHRSLLPACLGHRMADISW